MTTPDSQTTIASLQSLWTSITGQPLVPPRATERLFWDYLQMGFTADDLSTVLNFMLRFNKRHSGAYGFRINAVKILGDLEMFGSLLGEARAAERNRKPQPTARDKALAELRPGNQEPTVTVTTKTPGELLGVIGKGLR